MKAVSESQIGCDPANRSNPFCTRFVRPGAIPYRFDTRDGESDCGDASEKLLEQLASRRFGLIVGEHGSGKSTLLQTLIPKLGDRFVEVRTIQTHAPPSNRVVKRVAHRMRTSSAVMGEAKRLARGGLLIVDGIEQMGIASRYRLVGLARSKRQFVLATSHRHLSPFASLFRTQTTADLITELTEMLLAESPSELSSAIERELSTRQLTTLENVRELWFELYDVVETWRNDFRINQEGRV
jgi:nucleoside-triphosphatase THEP1